MRLLSIVRNRPALSKTADVRSRPIACRAKSISGQGERSACRGGEGSVGAAASGTVARRSFFVAGLIRPRCFAVL